MPGDHGGGGGAHQGQEAVPVIPIISPGRPVRAQDQQGGDVPGDHQGAECVGVLQGQEAVAVQQKLFRLLRWQGSPTLKRIMKLLQSFKRKPYKCSIQVQQTWPQQEYADLPNDQPRRSSTYISGRNGRGDSYCQ